MGNLLTVHRPTTPAVEESLPVAINWNIMNAVRDKDTGCDIMMRWLNIMDELTRMITARVQVIALQEMGRCKFLDDAVIAHLTKAGYKVIVCKFNESANSFAIFVAIREDDTMRVAEVVLVPLNDTLEYDGRTVWLRTIPVVRCVRGDEDITFVFAHPEVHEGTRVDSFDKVIIPLIKEEMSEGRNVVLLGNLNLFPDCASSERIIEELHELMPDSNKGAASWVGTPHDFPVEMYGEITKQLDWVFTNRQITAWFTLWPNDGKQLTGIMPNGVIDPKWNPDVYAMASDHLPVGVVFASPQGGGGNILAELECSDLVFNHWQITRV